MNKLIFYLETKRPTKKKQEARSPLRKNIALKRMLTIRKKQHDDDANIPEKTKRVNETDLHKSHGKWII